MRAKTAAESRMALVKIFSDHQRKLAHNGNAGVTRNVSNKAMGRQATPAAIAARTARTTRLSLVKNDSRSASAAPRLFGRIGQVIRRVSSFYAALFLVCFTVLSISESRTLGQLSLRSSSPAYTSSVALVSSTGVYCSGTVVAPRWVMTAAHCLEADAAAFAKGVPLDVTVAIATDGQVSRTLKTRLLSRVSPFAHRARLAVIGGTVIMTSAAEAPSPSGATDGMTLIRAKRLVLHPAFLHGKSGPNSEDSKYDVGLVELETAVPQTWPIAQLSPSESDRFGPMVMAGFGVGGKDGNYPGAGEFRSIPVTGTEYAARGPIHTATLHLPSPCFGDSGGGLFSVSDGIPQLIGVVSTTVVSATTGNCRYGMVAANLVAHQAWVKAIISRDQPALSTVLIAAGRHH